jgi:hypothetical protein
MFYTKKRGDNMYNAQTIKERIKARQKALGIKNLEKMLFSIGISPSTVYNMSDARGISAFKLAQIADQLDTSVDYLLGRSDVPDVSLSINNSHATITAPQTNVNFYDNITPDERELLNMIAHLSLYQRAQIILEIQKKINEVK